MKKILLFGSNGFIGTNIRLYYKNQRKFKVIIPTYGKNDVVPTKEIGKIIAKIQPDFVINAAYFGGVSSAVTYSKINIQNNIDLIETILWGCAKVKKIRKVIFFGSSLEYADSIRAIDETHPIGPKNAYATTKAVTSLLSLAVAKELKIPLILIKPFNLYGPFDTKSVVYYLIKSIITKTHFQITRGEQIRDYLYIEDFIHILDQILRSKNIASCGVYNLGSGTPIHLKKMYSLIFGLTKFQGIVHYKESSADEYWHQVSNSDKIKRLIRTGSLTPIDVGIKKTIQWIKSEAKK